MPKRRFEYGVLSIENFDDVAAMFNEILVGHRYTYVSCLELFGFKPDVRTGQRLRPDQCTDRNSNGINIHKEKADWSASGMHCMLNVNDSYGVWGISTTLNDEQIRKLTDRDTNPLVTYIEFDRPPRCEFDQIKIRTILSNGLLGYSCIAVNEEYD